MQTVEVSTRTTLTAVVTRMKNPMGRKEVVDVRVLVVVEGVSGREEAVADASFLRFRTT